MFSKVVNIENGNYFSVMFDSNFALCIRVGGYNMNM